MMARWIEEFVVFFPAGFEANKASLFIGQIAYIMNLNILLDWRISYTS